MRIHSNSMRSSRVIDSIDHSLPPQSSETRAALLHVSPELEIDERGVHIAPAQPRSGRSSRSGPRAVRFSKERKSGSGVSFLQVLNRIFYSGLAKTFQPQHTGIALAASDTFRRRVITAMCERKIDIELDGFADDFRF